MMCRRAIWILFVATSLAAANVAVAGEGVAASRARPLKALNVVEVTRSASMLVSLPRDATIRTPFGDAPDLSVKSGEGFVGFALVRSGSSEPFVVFGGRLPTSDQRDFVMPISNLPDRTGFNMEHVKNYPDEVVLPAGDYRLFVLTEGGRATLRLRLGGLRGTARLGPSTPIDHDIARPEPRAIGGAGLVPNMYSGGATSELTSEGLLFSALWLEHSGYLSGQFQFCHYEGDTEIEPVSYGPGCPNARASATSNNRMMDLEPGVRVQLLGRSGLEPDTQGQGVWYATEAVVEEAGYLAIALSYGG